VSEGVPTNKKRSRVIDLLLSVLLAVVCILVVNAFKSRKTSTTTINTEEKAPTIKFGFNLDEFHLESLVLKPDQFLGDILYYNGINYRKISELEQKSKDVYSVRKLKAGKELTIVKSDPCGVADCLIYEPDPFSYVLFDLRDSISVTEVEKEFTVCEETLSGVIETTLWEAMSSGASPYALISNMEDALGWSVDFPRAQKGDEFKLVYEMKYIDGEPVAVGGLKGAYYKNDSEHYALHFENDKYSGFYDLEGRATKRDFLKSPVRSSYISSRYNLRRFHPVLKRRRPHYGTDYAAAKNSPIRAVADGIVELASYTKNNGNYVKLRHDSKIKTQYLHMNKFASGVKRGTRVKQGQTIGYVGKTGLATGYHVCFRFWKNGKQVDHTRMNFPPPKPMDKDDLPAFFKQKKEVLDILQSIPSAQRVEFITEQRDDTEQLLTNTQHNSNILNSSIGSLSVK